MASIRKVKTLVKYLITGVLLLFLLYSSALKFTPPITNVRCPQQLQLENHLVQPQAATNPLVSSIIIPQKNYTAERKETTVLSQVVAMAEENALHVHIWYHMCGGVVQNLKEHPLFPRYPDKKTRSSTLKLAADEKKSLTDYGLRQFGFLQPPTSGLYSLAIYSDDSSELWFSTNDEVKNLKLIAKVGDMENVGWTKEGELNKYNSQKSLNIYLYSGKKYFIEVLFKQLKLLDHYGVLWKTPEDDTYKDIPGDFLHGNFVEGIDKEPQQTLENNIVNNPAHSFSTMDSDRDRNDEISRFNQLPYIEDHIIQDVLPSCEYKPSYLVTGKLSRYGGVSHPAVLKMNTAIYPADNTASYVKRCNTKDALTGYDCMGNREMDQKMAMLVASSFVFALNAKLVRNSYSLKNIFNVEKHPDDKGSRFLLELELSADSNDKSVRFSEYVFLPLFSSNSSSSLCYPKNYKWNKNATVHIISTAQKQPNWVQHLINSVAEVQRKTNDHNINLIISDYGNGEMDVGKALKKSGITRYQVIKKIGKFHKTVAIQEAAASVTNPKDIVFQLDLHLDVPVNLFDYVRKHCIIGKMAVTPIVMRLSCGSFPNNPQGHWETMGYGLFGVTKKDWDIIGGMNVKEFKNSWGGEDWELCDRTLMKGYEIERLRLPGLYHYFHDHKHLWNSKGK